MQCIQGFSYYYRRYEIMKKHTYKFNKEDNKMSILNSLPSKIGIATETSNGLMTSEDKKLINKINRIESDVADKMNKNEKIKSSQLDTSSNAVKIKPENLSFNNLMTTQEI